MSAADVAIAMPREIELANEVDRLKNLVGNLEYRLEEVRKEPPAAPRGDDQRAIEAELLGEIVTLREENAALGFRVRDREAEINRIQNINKNEEKLRIEVDLLKKMFNDVIKQLVNSIQTTY